MTTRKYSSRSQQTTLTAGINSSVTSATVVSGSALLGGITISAGETFTVVIDPDTALEEIVDVTAVSTNTLTIVRGIDGATPQAHSAGAAVRHMAIGRDHREANTHIENTTTAHGLTLANVVKTTDTGTVSTAMLQANAVTTAKIADANVTTAKLADGSVTSAKIADGTIATGDIADAAVTSAKIADGTIVNTDINSAAAIDKTKVAGTAVVLTDTGTVTSTMIADGTITNADINASAGIAYSKLNLTGAITSSDITDGTIVNADINASAAIALSKLATDPLARANHTGTQAASTISNFDTAVRTSRLDQMAAPAGDLSVNNQKITNLATPASSTDASTKGYVDTQITNLIGTAPSTLDTLQEIATAINNDAGLYTTLNNGKLNRDGTQAMTGALAMGTNKITGLGDPTNAQDGATKNYVDTGAASQVAAAAASATAAAGSASAASTSASNAATSASGASTSASNASASASAAATSASNAATSATNAANSATSASGSATTATTQASNAATSASNALTQANNASSSATAAAGSATSAAASYDSFDDRYLGAKSSPPTLDNDGNALLTGALYWNSVSNKMFVWSGSAWGEISSSADIIAYKFTAAGGETSESGVDDNGLTLAYLAGKEQVYLNGVLLARGSDYTASNGTSITGLAALVAGDILTVLAFTAFSVANTIPTSTLSGKGSIVTASAASTPANLAVGADGSTLVANSAASTGLSWAGTPIAAGKNAIINGAFDIAQRGTSIAVNAPAYTLDRWQGFRGVAGMTVSRQSTNDTTNLPFIQYCARIQRDSGNTSTSTLHFTSSIETANVYRYTGQTITLSFYARAGANYSAASNALGVFLSTGTGTDGNPISGFTGQANAISQTATLTTTWQRFSYSVTLGATITQLAPYFVVTPTGTAGANDWAEITGVQIELGSIATAFSRTGGTIAGELAACQRYFYRIGGNETYESFGFGANWSSTESNILVNFKQTMRVAPTMTNSGTMSNYRIIQSPSTFTPTSIVGYANIQAAMIASITTGMTQNAITQLQSNNTLNGTLSFSAEL